MDDAMGRWRIQPEQLARCLVVTIPSYMDRGYSDIAARFLDGRPTPVNPAQPAGTWLRTGLGYAFIGPTGGPHYYTRIRPPGIADADITTLPMEPPGRLIAALRAKTAEAKQLAAGEPVEAMQNGRPIGYTCPPADRPAIAAVAASLENTLAAAQPGYNQAILREHAALPLSELLIGGTAATAIQKSSAAVADLRTRYAADGWLTAVTLTRGLLADYLPPDAPGALTLPAKSMESLSCGHDPERMLQIIVLDYARAGHADLVIRVLDTAIAQARACKDAALAATTVDGHLGCLYAAAHGGFLAWLLSDLMRNAIPEQHWRACITPAKLSGYNATAEETVVRASAALQVGCINTATGAALRVHQAEVQTKGAAWADELITEYWYYPSCARNLLLPEHDWLPD